MELTGAEILIECLKKEGVHTIFGYPGGVVLNIYDELYDSDLRHILVRHEQGAVHAADGYARATRRGGRRPGDLRPRRHQHVTGLATAYMDSIPMVVITGQVPTDAIGNDAFQEADIVGITRPCTKHNYLVKDVRDLARIIKEASTSPDRPARPGAGRPAQGRHRWHAPSSSTRRAAQLRGYKPTYEGHIGPDQEGARRPSWRPSGR